MVAVFLDADCEGQVCPGDQTCTESGCSLPDTAAIVVEPGREFEDLCRPGDVWCSPDGTTLFQCQNFGSFPVQTPCTDGCSPGAIACNGVAAGPDPDDVNVEVGVGANGRVVSAPAGIACDAPCNAYFSAGTTVWLQAVPDDGYAVDAWSQGCATSGNAERCALDTTVSLSAGVTFRPIDGSGPGSGS